MNSPSLWKRRIAKALCVLAVSLSMLPLAQATDLPAGVLNYLRQKDPKVKVRFDGLVLFSNGESYVPVLPQDTDLSPDAQQVIATVPEKAAYPDLIQFDNNLFLMRLIQTASGRLTFPKLVEYPIQMKEGLLPQDFVLPNNLFIPVELKIILGALPYNPSFTETKNPVIVPAAVALQHVLAPGQQKSISRLTYIFDLSEQKIWTINPLTGEKLGDVALNCAPSALKLSPDGKMLLAPCLSTNELVVVDTGSNLVKTRIPVGQRPDAVLYLNQSKEVVTSNRYSPFLSIINSADLVSHYTLNLPGNGGAMAIIPGEGPPKIAVADAFNPKIYIVDVNSRTVENTLDALPEISAIRAFRNEQGQVEIWAASRTRNQVIGIDATSGSMLKTIEVGKKPIDLAVYHNKLLVVSAGDSRIDVIDRGNLSLQSSIKLEPDSFPSALIVVPSEKKVYVTMAANNNLTIINPESMTVESNLPVEFRASMIAMTPDQSEQKQATSPGNNMATPNKTVPAVSQPASPTKTTQLKQPIQSKTTPTLMPAKASPAQAVKTTTSPTQSKPSALSPVSLTPAAQPAKKASPQPVADKPTEKQPVKLGSDKAKTTHPDTTKVSPVTHPPAATSMPTSAKAGKPVAMPLDLLDENLSAPQNTATPATENTPQETRVYSAKPGAHKEQKPLAMPLELLNEETYAPTKGVQPK